MRRLFALLFGLLYLSMLVKPYAPWMGYYLAQDAYKAQCVNKDKPWLQCDGKCHLKTQLAAEQPDTPQEKEAPRPRVQVETLTAHLAVDAAVSVPAALPTPQEGRYPCTGWVLAPPAPLTPPPLA